MIRYRDPLAWTSCSSLFLQASLLSKKGSQYSKYGGVVKILRHSNSLSCSLSYQSAPKERRRRRAGEAVKRSSKRVFLESPFLLCPSKVCS